MYVFILMPFTMFTGDGDGQTVYVIDTGILHSHVDYGGRASYHFDFEDRVSLSFPGKIEVSFHFISFARETFSTVQYKSTIQSR